MVRDIEAEAVRVRLQDTDSLFLCYFAPRDIVIGSAHRVTPPRHLDAVFDEIRTLSPCYLRIVYHSKHSYCYDYTSVIATMSDNPTSPLLGHDESELQASSQRAKDPPQPRESNQEEDADENTSLLAPETEERRDDNEVSSSPAATWLRYVQSRSGSKGQTKRRWPTIVALSILTALMLVILGLGFAAPVVVEEYSKEAMIFEPTSLSIDSFTSDGVKARIRGDFTLDGSKVRRKPVRDLGRAVTWIAAAVESKETKVQVRLPEYDNLLLGTAIIPRIVVSTRDGETTHLDFLSDLHAGDKDGITRMAKDWIAGRIGSLSVQGIADVPLKSGIFGLGTKKLAETIVFSGMCVVGGRRTRADIKQRAMCLLFLLSISRNSISTKHI